MARQWKEGMHSTYGTAHLTLDELGWLASWPSLIIIPQIPNGNCCKCDCGLIHIYFNWLHDTKGISLNSAPPFPQSAVLSFHLCGFYFFLNDDPHQFRHVIAWTNAEKGRQAALRHTLYILPLNSYLMRKHKICMHTHTLIFLLILFHSFSSFMGKLEIAITHSGNSTNQNPVSKGFLSFIFFLF